MGLLGANHMVIGCGKTLREGRRSGGNASV